MWLHVDWIWPRLHGLYRLDPYVNPKNCCNIFFQIKNVKILSVQYNPPISIEEYVHRVGRTARIGAQGSSLLFLTPSETAFVDVLANHNIRCADWHLIYMRLSF